MVDKNAIMDHAQVVASCGTHVGVVDHLDGERIPGTDRPNFLLAAALDSIARDPAELHVISERRIERRALAP